MVTAVDSRCMSESTTHVLLFPFMSKGHIIPNLHFARLLLLRRPLNTTVTLFTTPATLSFVSDSLSDLPQNNISLVTLPFPRDIPGIPPNVESTEHLPSMSLFPEFASATVAMQEDFEKSLLSLVGGSSSSSPTFLVSDGFLCWTLESAMRFVIPRLVFYGMNNYAMAVLRSVMEENLLYRQADDDEPLVVGAFPWVKVTKKDFDPKFYKPNKMIADFLRNTALAVSQSYGMVVNSFTELEPAFLEKWNSVWGPKAWCVGPLSLLEPRKLSSKSGLLKWLDEKLARGQRVMYVAFGTQAELSDRQIKEIELGLENSGTIFLWVLKGRKEGDNDDNDDCRKLDLGNGVEAQVKGHGVVVRGWVDQGAVLSHDSVQGFVSHCGWNSALESICAGVPLLAWPVMAEQPLNARMVTEELGVGIRVETVDGSVGGFVTREGVERSVMELMYGEKGEDARRRVTEVRDMARKAMEPGGSSWTNLEDLLRDVAEGRRRMADKMLSVTN